MMDSDDELKVVEEVRKVFSKTAVPTVYALIENVTSLGVEDNVQTATEKICNFLFEAGDLYNTQENDLAENEPKHEESVSTYISNSAQTNSTSKQKTEQTATTSSQPKKDIEVKITEFSNNGNENRDPNSLSKDNGTFECACCFNDIPFTTMAQCPEGHLFCFKCMERYTQESVYGQGKCTLICMSADCGVPYLKSQLSRALPDDLYKKYEERISLESINSAGLENFVKCKFCNYGAELDPDAQFFSCTQCGKNFCRKCQELYNDHRGLSCEEIEKNEEKDIRKNYEERMTEAKIRTCSNCKSRFTKGSGCNKISCRCSTTMCYVCRKPNVKYDHFCQHDRLNGQKCNSCNRPCYLWSNADEDDKMAIEELKKQAKNARVQEGFTQERAIGAPNLPEPAAQAQPQIDDDDDDDDFDDLYNDLDEHYSDEDDDLDQMCYDIYESDSDSVEINFPLFQPLPPGIAPDLQDDENEDEWYDIPDDGPELEHDLQENMDDGSSNYTDVDSDREDFPEAQPPANIDVEVHIDSGSEDSEYPDEVQHEYPDEVQHECPDEVHYEYPDEEPHEYPDEAHYEYLNEAYYEYPNEEQHEYPENQDSEPDHYYDDGHYYGDRHYYDSDSGDDI